MFNILFYYKIWPKNIRKFFFNQKIPICFNIFSIK